MSNEVKLHPTSSDRAEDFLRRHVGELVDPPGTVERLDAIGPFVGQDVEVGRWVGVGGWWEISVLHAYMVV